jgi:hypothetical protein
MRQESKAPTVNLVLVNRPDFGVWVRRLGRPCRMQRSDVWPYMRALGQPATSDRLGIAAYSKDGETWRRERCVLTPSRPLELGLNEKSQSLSTQPILQPVPS